MKKFIRASEACKILSVTHPTLRRWALDGKIDYLRPGRNFLYDVESIREIANSGRLTKDVLSMLL